MSKRAVIVISLVDESVKKSNKEIENEIFGELSNTPPWIPWFKDVEEVKVTET
ncbi:MAG: hypothetical protein ACE5OW_03435 [Candidatus Bathyarchaeia archaeon]